MISGCETQVSHFYALGNSRPTFWLGVWCFAPLSPADPPGFIAERLICLTVSLSLVRDQRMDDQMHWVLGVLANARDRVLAAWQNVYQNIRFLPWAQPLSVPDQQVVRWGLRYRTAIRMVDVVSEYKALPFKNLLLLGIQGSGKSTTLLNVFKNSVRATWPDGTPATAVILFDIGKDTAQAALRLVPPDRTVIWFDPTDPANPWALQPLDTTVGDAAAMTQLIDTLQDIFGTDAVGPRSREILGHTMTAILAAGTPGQPRTLRDAYRFLTDEGYRAGLLSRALANPQIPRQTRDFWTVVLPNLLANNPRFWEEAVAAPRNKLDELLRHRAVESALGVVEPGQPRKRAINWDRVIAERQVVIVNLDMARLGGRSPVRLFGILMTQLLWRAIQRQGFKPESDRIPVRLLYDEAQEYLSPQFLDMLALGRAYGFQTVLATRFLLELRDPALQAGIVNLCQNRIIHRIPEPAEAVKLQQQMLTIYINNVTLSEEAQNLERFMADDIMRLPDHTAICLWQAKGAVQSPFIAETIDWRPEAHEEWAAYHLAHQAEWLPPVDD
jgi:hypothetical protein